MNDTRKESDHEGIAEKKKEHIPKNKTNKILALEDLQSGEEGGAHIHNSYEYTEWGPDRQHYLLLVRVITIDRIKTL